MANTRPTRTTLRDCPVTSSSRRVLHGGVVPASTSDRFRSMIAQPATRQSTAAETGTGLRLNMLPVVFPNEIQRDVVYSLPYTEEAWQPLRERARGGKEFHI